MDPLFYNTTLSQTISPCGNFLLAGNNYGNVAVYDLQKVFSQGDGSTVFNRKPLYHFNASNDLQVCCMLTTEKFLIIGTVGEISGYDWTNVTTTKHPKLSWIIQIPTSKDALEKPDINSLVFDKIEGVVYAGCGDNNIYVFRLDEGKLVRTLEGHDDYIHSIHNLGNQMASGSEDGTVRLWDLRLKKCTDKLQPYLHDRVARPDIGKWIGAVSLNEDWLVCGGGPKLSLWNLRSLELTTAVSLDDNGIHVAMFYDDHMMAGGASPYFYHLSYNGDIQAQIPTSSPMIYSVVHQESPHKILSLAGSSNKIDICTNYNYKDLTLSFSL